MKSPSNEIARRKLLSKVRTKILSLNEMVSNLDLIPKKVVEEAEEEEGEVDD